MKNVWIKLNDTYELRKETWQWALRSRIGKKGKAYERHYFGTFEQLLRWMLEAQIAGCESFDKMTDAVIIAKQEIIEVIKRVDFNENKRNPR